MKFLVDNQLPPALARLIQNEFGEAAVHVIDLRLRDASDAFLLDLACSEDAVLISKDEDFVSMVLREPKAGLIWVRIGNCRRKFLLAAFRRAWPRVMEKLRKGERFIEIR